VPVGLLPDSLLRGWPSWGCWVCVFVGFAMIVVDARTCSFVFGPGCVLAFCCRL